MNVFLELPRPVVRLGLPGEQEVAAADTRRASRGESRQAVGARPERREWMLQLFRFDRVVDRERLAMSSHIVQVDQPLGSFYGFQAHRQRFRH